MEGFEMMDSLVEKLQPIIETQQMLARKAELEYTAQVNAIIQEQCKDTQRIELVLTWMLDFCFDDRMLALFKKLCRYYYRIDPEATASYVYFYRDMWDSDEIPEDEQSDEIRS